MAISVRVIRDQAPEQEPLTLDTGTTGLDVFGKDTAIVAMRLNGKTVDLSHPLSDGDGVEPVLIDSGEGLSIIRHSCAHLTAQAVQLLFADAKLGIGPPITDGFYYDFQVATPFTPEDLKAIEKQTLRLIAQRQTFRRRAVSDDEARRELAAEPFKLELIADKGNATTSDGASVEVGAGELTIYDNLRPDGSVAWKDLCRGPHVPHTGYLRAMAITRNSAAYWRGDQSKESLQRVYGTAWPTKEALSDYQHRLAEAARRDHRRLGAELDLFSFPEELGAGLPVFHPRGGVIKREMEDYVRKAHIEAGFQYVGTPHLAKEGLFYTSGHLPYYEDLMFPEMVEGDRDEQGNVIRERERYRVKAMNCPMHNLIFKSRGRSYRELPLRFFEFGTVYRDEKSGVLQGLTRVRSITQDDSHSYVMAEQASDEIKHLLDFILKLLRDFGLEDFYLELSTRDKEGKNKDKFIGSDEDWDAATAVLEQVGKDSGLELVPDPGGAAYYGPKISVQAKDAIGRTWQMSTIQYDFNQPERFELEYAAPDGSRQRPVMIHSAKFGSIERFMGVLTEHYAGAFPVWLAPVQVLAIPVSEDHLQYLAEVARKFAASGIRIEQDSSDDRFGKKIRNAAKQKVPFILIAGDEDVAKSAVSFRYRDGSQNNGIGVDDAIAEVQAAIRARAK
ncbi:MAG: threonine--tRNA ligase [Propionibacteriaceae bacterium]|jgi:threonyl-tRNA synthetase|nr:threonine--tRNA ligase [Propionibacteriaceae bacterium]